MYLHVFPLVKSNSLANYLEDRTCLSDIMPIQLFIDCKVPVQKSFKGHNSFNFRLFFSFSIFEPCSRMINPPNTLKQNKNKRFTLKMIVPIYLQSFPYSLGLWVLIFDVQTDR